MHCRVNLKKKIQQLDEQVLSRDNEGLPAASPHPTPRGPGVHTPLPQNGHMGIRNFAEIAPNAPVPLKPNSSSFSGTYESVGVEYGQNLFSSSYKENIGPYDTPSTFSTYDGQMGGGQGTGFKATSLPFKEVNYSDGSTDKKWSGRHFSWTRELEVDHCDAD
jgi:hypothetical protein